MKWSFSNTVLVLTSHLDAKLNFVSQITFQFLELLLACAWETGSGGAQSGKAFLPRCITFCIKCHVTFITLGSCRHSVLMENFSSPIFSITLGGKSLVGALGKAQSSVLGQLFCLLPKSTLGRAGLQIDSHSAVMERSIEAFLLAGAENRL